MSNSTEHHFSYGGGLSGCLYDYGPNYAEHKGDAVDALVWLYADGLADGEEARMRRNLIDNGIHYFDNAAECGAHYCELTKQAGPCPEES